MPAAAFPWNMEEIPCYHTSNGIPGLGKVIGMQVGHQVGLEWAAATMKPAVICCGVGLCIPQGRLLSTSPAEFHHGAAFPNSDPGKDGCGEPGYRSSSVTSLGYSGSCEVGDLED